jgi:hypothetical protein
MSELETPTVQPKKQPPKPLSRMVGKATKALLRSRLHGIVSETFMLLTVGDEASGESFTFPVAYHELDGNVIVVPEGGWRFKMRGGAPVEVTLRGERRAGRAELIEDADEVARIHKLLLDRVGLEKAGRLGIKLNEKREPTLEELKRGIAHKGVVRLELQDGAAVKNAR